MQLTHRVGMRKGSAAGHARMRGARSTTYPQRPTSSVSSQFNGRAPMRLDKGGLFGVPAHETLPQARPRMAP